MKKTVFSLAAIAMVLCSEVAFANPEMVAAPAEVSTCNEITAVEQPAVVAATAEASPEVVQLPPRVRRRKMLFDFGLFGMGLHVGWMRPRSAISSDVCDHHFGKPILNVSAGTYAVGLGRH